MRYLIQITSLIFVFANCKENFSTPLEIDNFIDSALKEIDVHQVILITDDKRRKANNNVKVSITEKFITRYPAQQYTYQEIFHRRIQTLGQEEPLRFNRSAVLFVTIFDTDRFINETEQNFVKTLRASSTDSFFSRFILFFFSEETGNTFHSLMQDAWLNDMIDVVVYEIIVSNNIDVVCNEIEITESVSCRGTKYFLMDNRQNILFIHRVHIYNPFTDEYNQAPFNSSALIFPNKLLNMHKYNLRIGIVNYPPYSHFAVNETGDEKYQSVEGELIRTLKKVINFTMLAKGKQLHEYGILFANGSASGLLGDLITGVLDIIAFGAMMFDSPFNRRVDRTTFIRYESCCAIVPVIPDARLITASDFYVAGIMSISLVTFVWLFSFAFRATDHNIWNPLNIIFLILGITVPQQPTRLNERFLYGCIMIVSLFYSSNIFAQLTSFNVETDSVKPFNTFEELYDSGLTPLVHPNMFHITFNQTVSVLQKLGQRARVGPDLVESCPNWLMNSGNVTCIGDKGRAEFLIKYYKKEGKDMIKLAQPCFWSTIKAYLLRKASPYTIRFSQVIMHIAQSGIEYMWWQDYLSNYAREIFTLDSENMDTKLEDNSYKADLFFIGMIGYLASFCAFVGEFVVVHIRKKFTLGQRTKFCDRWLKFQRNHVKKIY